MEEINKNHEGKPFELSQQEQQDDNTNTTQQLNEESNQDENGTQQERDNGEKRKEIPIEKIEKSKQILAQDDSKMTDFWVKKFEKEVKNLFLLF